MQFAHPYFLWAIPVLIFLFALWLYFRYRKDKAAMTLSNTQMFDNYQSWKSRFLVLLPFLRLLSLCLVLVALARPQSSSTDQKISSYGIDMVISMDISSSMLAQDFKPNRLEAAKDVASRFIQNRPSDRIGLVVFAGESFTQVPITTDHKIVQSQLSKVKNGLLSDGTAIGMGIGTGVNRLKDSKAKSKVIILMTDGVNNTGLIDPITATEAAMQFDIKIYTIGIGTEGEAYMPAYMLPNGSVQYDYLPVMIDEELLTEISKMTNGKYYRAKDKEALEAIYEEIDQLEKTEIESSQSIRVEELFYNFAALAILLLFIEQALRYSLLRSFP
ncbi:MAG: VWA domain-containing protein [Chitinophagales bacterium]|nr:VWA domain-containing protein [Chitinophagales bacterium]